MKSGNFKFETLFIGDNKILTYFYPQAKSPCLLFTGKHLYSWSLRLFNVFCTFQGCLLKLDTQHGSAPMYGKCRLHDNINLKPSYDETYYWRNLRWDGEGFSLNFSFKRLEKFFPTHTINVVTSNSANKQLLFECPLLWKRHFPYIRAHPEYITLINNLGTLTKAFFKKKTLPNTISQRTFI